VKKLYSIFLALLLFLISCGSGSKNESVVVPTSITLDKTSVVLVPRQSATLTANITPYNPVTWTSSNSNIATVNATGMITAVSKGTCDIIVTARESRAVCKVVVPTGSVNYSWLVVGEDQGRAMVWTDRGNYDLGIGVARHVEKSDDGILFIAGESEGHPTLWIGNEFEKHVLSETKGKGNFVYLNGDDVYVAGQVGIQAAYWKNITQNILPGPSSGNAMLSSEANSMVLLPSGIYIVGSGEFSRLLNYAPPTSRMQSCLTWETGFAYAFTEYAPGLLNILSYDIVKIINDGTILRLGTLDRYGKNNLAILYALRDDQGGSAKEFYDNGESLYAYDVTPFGHFKTEISRDNSVLIATNIGVYKVTNVPNKAYLQTHNSIDGTLFQETLLPGYGYSRTVRVLGSDVYSAGKNLIYKNGNILTTLSSTSEIYSLLVQ